MFRRSVLLVLLLTAVAAAQDFAEAVPEKTAFFLSFENMARTRERFSKSGFHAMWNDDAMAPLRRKFDEALQKLESDGPNPFRLAELVPGQMCLAIIPRNQHEYAALGLVDMGDKRREILDLVERLKETQEGEAREIEEDFHGYAITTRMTLAEGETEPDTDYYATKDGLFAICDDLDVLKDALTRRAAGDKTGLAHTEAFRKTARATGERSDVRFYVPASAWLREGGMMVAPVLATLGLEGVKGVGGQLTLGENGVAMRILIHDIGEPAGLVKILGANVDGLGPPKILPPGVEPALAWALDWQLVYREVFRVLGTFDPAQSQQMQAGIAEMEKQLGFRIHDDLLASFAPGTFYGLLPASGTAATEIPVEKLVDGSFELQHAVVLQKLRDKDTVRRILAKMAAEDGSGYKETEYLGTTIWEASGEHEPCFAIVGEHAVMGFRPESVQTLIRRQGKNLDGYRDGRAYKDAQAHAPAGRSMLVVSDARSPNGLFMWEGVRRGFEQTAPEEWTGLLPDREFLRRYLHVSLFSLSREEAGLLFNWFWGATNPEADEAK